MTLKSLGIITLNLLKSESFKNAIYDNSMLLKNIKNGKGMIQTIQDEIIIMKLNNFINETKQLLEEERSQMVDDLINSKGGVEHTGALLLDIISKNDDFQKPVLIGKLFKACACKKITQKDFFKFSSIINNLFIDDILNLENIFKADQFDDVLKQKLLANGLMDISIARISDPDKDESSLRYLLERSNKDNVELRYTINDDCKTLSSILFNASKRYV